MLRKELNARNDSKLDFTVAREASTIGVKDDDEGNSKGGKEGSENGGGQEDGWGHGGTTKAGAGDAGTLHAYRASAKCLRL